MPEWSGDGPLLGHRPLIAFSHGRRELSVVFFVRALIPFMKVLPS